MTVQTTALRGDYTGNGVTVAFAVPFYFLENSHVQIEKLDTLTNTTTTLALTTDYTLAGAGVLTGGTATLLVAPLSTDRISITRNVPYTQQTHYVEGDPFPSQSHEAALDKLTMLTQQLDEESSRSVKAPASAAGFDGELPAMLPSRLVATNAAGTGFELAAPSSGSAAELALDLADDTSAVKGAAKIGFNAALSYAAGTVGANLKTCLAFITSLASSTGAALVGYVQAGTGAAATTQQEHNRRIVSVFDFLSSAQKADVLAGTAISNFAAALDCGAAIQAALDYANTIALGTAVDGLGAFHLGGVKVIFPRGAYKTTTALTTYQNIEMEGDGRWSSVVVSSYDGKILSNALPGTDYNHYGIVINSMAFVGDRTKTNQIGIALMRAWQPSIKNVSVLNTGSDGVHLYQNVIHRFENLEVQKCVGYGIVLDQGYTDWTLATPNNLPTIDGRCTNCHFGFNDKPGVRLQGYHDSNQFVGGSSEQNNQQADHVGYQIECVGTSVWPDEFVDFSCESQKGFANILVDLGSTVAVVRFTRFHHSAVVAGTLDRCANVVKGKLVMDRPYGNAQAYRSLGGKTTPFQITKATATIRIHEPIGSGVNDGVWVNDETNATTGLSNNVFLTSREYTYGPNKHRSGFGELVQDWQIDQDAYPWMSLQSFYKGILFGPGSAAATAGLFFGNGTPEGSLTAGKGSIYGRWDGGAGTSFYVKESGTGNTGWVGK